MLAINNLNSKIFNFLEETKKSNQKNDKINITELLKIYYKYKDNTNDNIDYSKFLMILINDKIIAVDNNMEYFSFNKI